MTTTNKYGSMLRELMNEATTQARKDEIFRLFDEFSEREEKYKSWLQRVGSNPVFESPRISNPVWTSKSPLHVLQGVKGTLANVANNTNTPITWDTSLSSNRGSAFSLDPSDSSKIRFGWQGWSFAVLGSMGWESNTTGYRKCQLEFFDVSDVSLGSLSIAVMPPVQTDVTNCPIADTVLDVPAISYFIVSVAQTSGTALDLNYIRLGFFLI